MKRFVRGIQVTSVVVGIVLFWWATTTFTTRYFKADRFTFQFSGSFCISQQTAIETFFSKDGSLKNTPLTVVVQQARQQFPSIKTISLQFDASGATTAKITSVTPLLNINHNLILSEEGSLFRRSLFDEVVTAQLEQIDVPKFDGFLCVDETLANVEDPETIGRLAQPLFDAAISISQTLFDLYYVSCQDKANWWLQDKKQKKFYILFEGMQIPDEKILSACATMKGTLVARGEFNARRTQSWVADVRFDDQVILFAKPGCARRSYQTKPGGR